MRKFKIGYRTFKTAVGAALAIIIAQFFNLSYFPSAGIVTVLCVQDSKKKSLKSASARFFACMLGILFSFLFFEGITYHPVVIGLLLLLFIPTTVFFKINEGIVTSSVVILHIYSEESMTMNTVINEISIVIIGIGVALLVNLYMPSLNPKLKQYQKEIELNFRKIFEEIAAYLRTNESHWTGKEITETSRLIEKAKSLAFRDIENHFLRSDDYYYYYFKAREKQFEIIERVLPLVTSIEPIVEQRYMIADFIEELSLSIHPGNTAQFFLEKIRMLKEELKNMPLPKTREEFEARAELHQFVREMEQYLVIKKSLKVE